MNLAVWKKAVSDAWKQLAVSCGLLVLFGWVFVWLTSLFKMGAWGTLLKLLPNFVQPLLGVPLADLATPTGRLSFLYVHPITVLVCIAWAVSRGSDSVSGDIARGRMELLLTLPVRRVTVLIAPSVVSSVGAALLAGSVWIGAWLGLATIRLEAEVPVRPFLPAVVNLFAMMICLGGVTTLLSSWDHDRWRPIWLGGGFFVVSEVLDMISRLWEPGWWLKYATFLTAYDPQRLILTESGAWSLSLRYDGVLLLLGLMAYAAAALVFTRRDIPLPH